MSQGFYELSRIIKGLIIKQPFHHRGKPTISRANSPIIPVAEEIPPDERLEFLHGHILRIAAVIKQFRLHSGPHAFTAGVVVTSAASAVHALLYAKFADGIPVKLAGILAASITVDNRSTEVWIGFDSIFQGLYA